MEKGSAMKYLKMAGNVILYVLILALVAKLIGVFMDVMYASKFRETIDMLNNTIFLHMVLLTIIPVLTYTLIFKFRKESLLKFCKFKKMSSKSLILTLIIGIAMSIFSTHFISISSVVQNFPEFSEYLGVMEQGTVFTAMLILLPLFPIFEEILFRGLVYNELKKGLPIVAALIIQALLYVPFQPNIPVAVYAFVGFVFYCLVYEWTDSIWGSMLAQLVSLYGIFIVKRSGLMERLSGFSNVYLIGVCIISVGVLLVASYYLSKNRVKVQSAEKQSAVG